METLTIDLKKKKSFEIGQQGDHNALCIHFINMKNVGTNKKYIYYTIDGIENCVPLTNDRFIVGYPLTAHSGIASAQLISKLNDNSIIKLSNVFAMHIKESKGYKDSGEYPVDPNIQSSYDLLDDLIDQTQDLINNYNYATLMEKLTQASSEATTSAATAKKCADELKDSTDFINTLDEKLAAQDSKIEKIEASTSHITTKQNTKIAALKTRMSSFTSLKDGSTTGDAELIDARIGADGTKYPSAGDAMRGQVERLNEDLMEKIMYLESNVTVTDGERGHRTNAVLDMSQPVYVSITPATTNTFNVFITHEEEEVHFLTAKDINGGENYTWVFDRQIIDNIAKDYGVNAYDDKWRVNIRNATNSNNYRYSIFIKENEKVEHDKKVCVSSTKDAGTFSLVSYACNYLKAKYNNVPCTVFVKNGVYEEKPITEFPYAPINIADTMINVIGESVDGVIINLINSSQKQNRIMHIGGFQTIANMTLNVLADDTYQGNTGNNPYVIHNDDTYNNFIGHYSPTVENCKLYSECSSPIGGGLHGNQTQIYRNVVFIYNSKHDSGGCLYVHGASNEGQIPDGLIIDGCTAISKNGTLALMLPSVTGYTPYTETPVTIRRTILATNGDTEVASDFKSTHKLMSDSKLNSNDYINY